MVTFQELNVGDEFTDKTGIKYRKTVEGCSAGSRTNAIVIEHPILDGLYISVRPDEKVKLNKVVHLEKIGNLRTGDVVKLDNGNYGVKLCYEVGIFAPSFVLDMNKRVIDKYHSTKEFEHVGHINLKWPQ